MSQIDQFLSSLKRSLKAKNILYKDLAKALKLSESSVKRILSSKSLSLERLEEICRVADLSFSEVVRTANLEENNQMHVLSEEQEKALAENARLLHYYMMLHDGKTPQKIEREYQIPNAEAKKFLFQLDRLNLIELHPRDKVKVKRHGFLRFRRDGPVGRTMFEQTKSSYLSYDFRPEDYIRFSFMKISTPSLAKFKSKLDRLVVELQEEARFENDSNVPVVDTGILMAFRPWKYTYMEAIKKKQE
jgi:transcriptional regulator with XRE-family HTH domain